MPPVLLRLTLHPDAPPAAEALPEAMVLTGFGRWLRERIASARLDWPSVAFHRLRLTPDCCTLTLIPAAHAPPLLSALLIGRALAIELELAAGRAGWIERGAALWQAEDRGPRTEHSRAPRLSVIGSRSSDLGHRISVIGLYDLTLRNSTTATSRKTAFIAHAAAVGSRYPLPPIAFMICVPVR